MTQDEIIEMAREAGLAFEKDAVLDFDNEEYSKIWQTYMFVGKQEIETFAKLVAAKEREACAKVCDEVGEHPSLTPQHCAESIRARGEQA